MSRETIRRAVFDALEQSFNPTRREPTMGRISSSSSVFDRQRWANAPLAWERELLGVAPQYTGPSFPESAKVGARVKLKHKTVEQHVEFIVGGTRVRDGVITALIPKGLGTAYSAIEYSYELLKAPRVPLPQENGVYMLSSSLASYRAGKTIYVFTRTSGTSASDSTVWTQRYGNASAERLTEESLAYLLEGGNRLVKLIPGRP